MTSGVASMEPARARARAPRIERVEPATTDLSVALVEHTNIAVSCG